MAKITLDILKKTESRNSNDIFRDLNLDYEFGKEVVGELSKPFQTNDIFTDKNLNAIANSFVSILTTSPGSKILNPRFGVNLGNLLFLPVTSGRGQSIGEGIVEAIQRYENRIIIHYCIINSNDEEEEHFMRYIVDRIIASIIM